MNKITINDLLLKVETYNKDTTMIKRAYECAELLHEGQYRQSGEPYIVHPLNVAYILADMNADVDTICAALLHDTIEDTDITKEELSNMFNPYIANLVDGVTKISKMNFSSKNDANLANTRKIITGITEDVRIIIIKLADRLHNMRTLQYKSEFKQKENSLETMEIFVPLAYYIGAYRIKSELEDISLQYLKPYTYRRLQDTKLKIEEDSKECLKEMRDTIKAMLDDQNIPNEIKIRTKNIYGIYKRLDSGDKISDIHDLLALKIMVDKIANCYLTLMMIHSKYKPINNKFKDFICNPKTNMYKSLHTTVFGERERLVQTQIRTFDMDKVASFGLTAYWDLKKENTRDIMQKNLKERYQFYESLLEINSIFGDNQEFINNVKSQLFSGRIYVYNSKGNVIELPLGSTPIDFAYKMSDELGNSMTSAIVNDKIVPLNYVLQNKDRVKIVVDDKLLDNRVGWEKMAYTPHAKRKILEFNKK